MVPGTLSWEDSSFSLAYAWAILPAVSTPTGSGAEDGDAGGGYDALLSGLGCMAHVVLSRELGGYGFLADGAWSLGARRDDQVVVAQSRAILDFAQSALARRQKLQDRGRR